MFVLSCVDGCMPSDLATGTAEGVEEERRLLYVAMTRARDELHLVQPERFYVTGQARTGDRHVRVPRTRFVTEAMPGLFEVVMVGARHAGGPSAGSRPAGLRGMWKWAESTGLGRVLVRRCSSVLVDAIASAPP